MPIIKSAIKRVRQVKARTRRNAAVKAKYRALTKQFTELVEAGKKAEAKKLMPQVQKAIDMATKKNQLQKNTAGRRKSALMKMVA